MHAAYSAAYFLSFRMLMPRMPLHRRSRIFDRMTGAVPPTCIGAAAVSVSCIAGSALSFFGFKLRETVSATSFTFIGVVCKFVTVLVNQIIWVHHGSSRGALILCGSIVLSTMYVAPRRIDEIHAAMDTLTSRDEVGAFEDDEDDQLLTTPHSELLKNYSFSGSRGIRQV